MLVRKYKPIHKLDICVLMPEGINVKERKGAEMRNREGHGNGEAILHSGSGKLL